VNVVSPSTCPASRRPRFLGLWGACFLAVAGGLLSGFVRADEPVLGWSPVATEPAVRGLPNENELATKASLFERERRWADVVSICETAARKGTLAPELQQRYDLAKIHCDIARRHNENAFRAQLAKLTESDARRLYAEVLARIASHHVEVPNFARLLARGGLAMDVAIEDPQFVSLYVSQPGFEHVQRYREQITRLAETRTVASQGDAEASAAWIASIAHTTLGIPPVVTLMEMTAAAMGSLDEYSAFLTTGQLDDLYAQIEGNFVGLGVELKAASDGLLVVHVIPGSPAQRAGLRAGDHLVGVGGRSIGGMSVDQAAQLLQGPPGSLVTLAILRAPSPARAVTVRREHVEVPSVEEVRMVDPAAGVAHLKISSFQKTTAADLEAALRRLDVAGMRSLIIDLRGNPGGLLSAAVDVADLFLERGLVVATRGRSPEEDFNYTASRAGTWRMPLVLVIDGESASSSEIFAGAIRDHARGTIVGTRSYGKGSIQGIFPLEVGGVGMRLTTAKFYSPNGHPYSGVGVEPHLAVHAVARPVDGVALAATPSVGGEAPAADLFLDTAIEVARRSVARPAARSHQRASVSR
jgi:carboxyl-terminal processing protease